MPNTLPDSTGNATLDLVNQNLYQEGEDARNAVPLTGLADSYQASLEDPMVKADAAGKAPDSVTLTDDDDAYLPYLQDVEENWDLREQAYQDQSNGKQRIAGEVSNEYIVPGRKTVHGLDIATGQRILNRDSGIPEAEEAYARGREQLRQSTFNVTEGYGVDGLTGLSSIAEGVVQEDKSYAEFERKVDMLGVPPEQAKLAWQTANRQVMQSQVADAIDHAIESNEDDTGTVDRPDIDMDQLPEVEGWADATKLVYEAEEGRPFDGPDSELVDWYVDQMSSFNWKIGVPGINSEGMAYYMSRAFEEDESYAQALLSMVDTYDRVNTNWDIVGRNIGQVVTDPVNLLGVPGGAALGTKVGGMVAKNAMAKWLTARVAARGAGIGAAEGSIWAGSSEAMMQQVEQEAGARGEVSYGQIAGAAGVGAAVGAPVGATMGVALPFAARGTAKAFRTMRRNARNGSIHGPLRKQIGAINPDAATPFRKPDIPDDLQPMATLNNSNVLAESRQFQNKRELKLALQEMTETAMKKAGVNLLEETDETNRILAEVLLDDARAALLTNANAIGWYDKTVSKAMRTLELMHPELKTDADAKTAFTYALAVTSNGMKVSRNFKLAEAAYRIFKGTGKMPTDIGEGKQGSAMNTHMELWNNMVDEIGIDGLRTLFDSKTTIGALKKAGFSVGGEHVATEVYGSAIIGPKIGNGFYSNLNGKFDQLTMDLWLRRTYGRITADLIRERPDMVAKKRTQVKQAIRNLREEDPKTLKAIEAITGKLNINSGEALDKAGVAIQKATMLPANRTVMNAHPSGADLRKSGNGLAGYLDNQIDVPSAAERVRIRKLFNMVLDDLRGEYPDLTMADLQALLWYPEKRLYDKAKSKDEVSGGYTDDEAPDYANAAAALAAESGIDDKLIKEAQANVDPTGRPRAGSKPEQGQDQPSGTKKTGQGSESKATQGKVKRPYQNTPDSLMGFSNPSRGQKGFDETKYKKEIVVRITFPDGQTMVDAQRGLNTKHATERAHRNWDGAEIEVLAEGANGLSDEPKWYDMIMGDKP